MNKSDMIDALKVAKKTHQEQMEKIEKLLEGKEVEKPTPVEKTDCRCGQMFYADKEFMVSILGLQLFEKLDLYHEAWHKEYQKIHSIFFKEKKGLFSKLFKSKPDTLELDKAKMYYQEMKTISEELYNVTEAALRRITALSDAKFH
jgi:hypothetical protein